MNSESAQREIARLYVERNRRYETLPTARTVLNIGSGSGSFVRNYPHRALIVNIDRGDQIAGYPAFGVAHKGFDGFVALAPDGRCVNVRADVLETLPHVTSGLFDMVVAGQIIEHLSPRDLELLLHESGRVLVPGGLLQIDTVTDRLGEDTEGHEQHFSAETLGALLEHMGFDKMELTEFAGGTAVWALYRRT